MPSFREMVALTVSVPVAPVSCQPSRILVPFPRLSGIWGAGVVLKLGVSGFGPTSECPRGPNTGLTLLKTHFLLWEIRLPAPVSDGCEQSPRSQGRPSL